MSKFRFTTAALLLAVAMLVLGTSSVWATSVPIVVEDTTAGIVDTVYVDSLPVQFWDVKDRVKLHNVHISPNFAMSVVNLAPEQMKAFFTQVRDDALAALSDTLAYPNGGVAFVEKLTGVDGNKMVGLNENANTYRQLPMALARTYNIVQAFSRWDTDGLIAFAGLPLKFRKGLRPVIARVWIVENDTTIPDIHEQLKGLDERLKKLEPQTP